EARLLREPGLRPDVDLAAQQVQRARIRIGPAGAQPHDRRAVDDAQRDRVGLDVFARVAGDHREAQAEQVVREARTLQRRLELAQAAALAEDELAEAPQLALRKAGRVDV